MLGHFTALSRYAIIVSGLDWKAEYHDSTCLYTRVGHRRMLHNSCYFVAISLGSGLAGWDAIGRTRGRPYLTWIQGHRLKWTALRVQKEFSLAPLSTLWYS